MKVRPSTPRLWLALAPAMVLPTIAAMGYFWWFADRAFAAPLYGFTKIFTVVWPAIAWRWVLGQPWPRLRRPDRRTLRHAGWGLLTGTALSLLILGVSFTPLWTIAQQAAPAIRQRATQLNFLDYYILFALFLSIMHAAIEEVYWRGFLCSALEGVLPGGWVIILASLAFTSHHVVVLCQYFPYAWAVVLSMAVFAGGVVWCLMYRSQRALIGPWVSHMLVDLAVMALGYKLLFGAQAG